MKNLLIICFVAFSFSGYGQFEGGVQWNEETKLNWSDFQGRANAGSHHHALTASGISIDMKQESEDSIGITVQANFFPKQSWIKKGKENDYLLNHEQRHFDIAELYRRKLIKELLTSKAVKSSKINEAVDKLYKSNDAELMKFQASYDEETHHSQVKNKQEVWDRIIDNELNALSKYNVSQIKFSIELVMKTSTTRTKTTSTRKKKSAKRKRRG